MNSSEICHTSMSLLEIAAASLKETGKYTATAEKCYKGRTAPKMALEICCDLRDIGFECHVDGDTITLDA